MKIVKHVENLINDAKFLEVTDIHFQPQENKCKMYYRTMEKLSYQKDFSIEEYQKLLRYIKFKSKLDIALTKTPQDGAFTIENEIEKVFVRVSTIPLLEGESLVLRLLSQTHNLKFNELSYNLIDLSKIKNEIQNNIGLFIFTGPTGSGKTTTMYAILEEIINQEYQKVITIENPIEIINNNFVQIQIDEKIDMTYAKALKSVLRQDPDIIMIGEIRDEETARNVFRAALTGHRVISTMHTKNIYGVIERFLDFGFLKSEIESVLIGISNQRLMLNPEDKIKVVYDYVIQDNLKRIIRQEINNDTMVKKIQAIKAQGFIQKKI